MSKKMRAGALLLTISLPSGLQAANIVSITDPPYNANGADMLDDSNAIRAALANHRTIHIPDGVFYVSRQGANGWAILLESNKKIWGNGPGRSIIRLADAQDAAIFRTASSAGRVTISDIEIDGNASGQTNDSNDATNSCIFVMNSSSNILVESSHVHNCDYSGIRVQPDSTHITIRDNHLEMNEHSGIELYYDVNSVPNKMVSHAIIQGNLVHHNGHAGINAPGSYVSVSGNVIHHNGLGTPTADGITLYHGIEGHHISITGNVIHDESNHGIHSGGNFVTITGNAINNVAYTGIFHGTSHNNDLVNWGVTISSNTVQSAGAHGIEVRNPSSAIISANQVHGSGDHGILVRSVQSNSASARVAITGNTSIFNVLAGIRATDLINGVVSSNVVTNNGTHGIALSDGANNAITGNSCHGNINSGDGATNYGVHLIGEASDTVVGNNLRSNEAGINGCPTNSICNSNLQ